MAQVSERRCGEVHPRHDSDSGRRFSSMNFLRGGFDSTMEAIFTCTSDILIGNVTNMMSITRLHHFLALVVLKLKFQSLLLLKLFFSIVNKLVPEESFNKSAMKKFLRIIVFFESCKQSGLKAMHRKHNESPRLPLLLLVPVMNMFLLPKAQGKLHFHNYTYCYGNRVQVQKFLINSKTFNCY